MAEESKVTDSFTYSDGDLETVSSSTWMQVRPVDAGSVVVATNRATFTGSGLATARHTGGSGWTAEQWAEVTLVDKDGDGTGRGGVIVRASADEDSTADFYAAWYSQASGETLVFKCVNGTFTQLGTNIAVAFADGDIIKLYAETSGGDTNLTVFKNGSSIGVRTDSPTSIAGASTDRVGVIVSNASVLDGFSGGILTSGNAQLLSPIQDISSGPWLPSSGSPAELWQMIDGEKSPDTDYDYTTSAGTMEVKFAPGGTPTLQTGHTIRYRLRGNGTCDALVKLKCGSTVIAQWTETNVPAVDTDYEHTLDSSPSFTISDYSDLRISVEAVP